MIDTPKFAFILAPYEIAVPTTTCCSNKRKGIFNINSCIVLDSRSPGCTERGKTWETENESGDGSISSFSSPLPLPVYA